ncbi:MAG TPA: NAD(P)/FAD-dependent oxidoreductase [Candidatus Dormibacteraeota bacterium]
MAELFADLAIVGGGIAGGALATAMSRAGRSVVVLERNAEYHDSVRGESIVPWGVREANRLELTDDLVAAGGHWTTRWVSYNETLTAAEAEARALALDRIVVDVRGALNMPHPAACRALRDAATRAGARYEPDARVTRLEPGARPLVTYEIDGTERSVRCRLVVGADGRNSPVRQRTTPYHRGAEGHHMVAGLLVQDLRDLWESADVQTVEGRTFFLGLPQGGGRARVYLAFEPADRARFSGPDRAEAFLAACRCRTVRQGDVWADARPAGPCGVFGGEDLVTESPVSEGVVLVGDAAGYISPLIGQGMSMALRDVRVLADILRGGDDWSEAGLRGYVAERRERMRRLRAITRLYAAVFADFSPGVAQRRLRVSERMEEDATLALPFAAVFAGPELVPGADFVDRVRERLLAPAPDAPVTAEEVRR